MGEGPLHSGLQSSTADAAEDHAGREYSGGYFRRRGASYSV
jgi:hypothetical protein